MEDDDPEDVAAGPEPPSADDTDFGPDDDEGRFFGGGITENTAEILDFMDEQDKDDAGVGRSAAVRKGRS